MIGWCSKLLRGLLHVWRAPSVDVGFLDHRGPVVVEKTGETYARNGQVSSTNDWCVDAVFSGELFAFFFGWKTPRSEFFGGLDKDLIFLKHMQDTKVTKKGVRDSCLGHSFSTFLYSWWCLFPCFESCWCYVFVFCRVNDKTLLVWRKAGFWTNQPLLIWVNDS